MPQNRRFQYQQFSSLPILPGSCAFQFDAFQTSGPRAFQGCPQIYEYAPLSTPLRRGVAVALIVASGLIASPFTPSAEEVTVDKWYRPISEPVRTNAFRTALQDTTTTDPTPVVPRADSWIFPLTDPVRFKRLPTAQHPTTTIAPTQPTGQEVGWYNALSDPVRFKRLSTAQQQSLAYTAFTPETVTSDKWLYQLSDPVRFKRISTAQQQSFTIAPTQPNGTDGWFAPLGEPVRFKRFAAALQPFFTIDPYPIPFVSPDAYAFRLPLSEPVRFKRFPAAQQQAFTIDPYILTQAEAVLESKWHQAWSEPVRQKRGIPVNLQRSFTGPEVFTGAVFEDSWHYPWSEPVRLKRGLRAGTQPSFVLDPLPRVSFSWFGRLNEPVRQKKGVQARFQQFFAPDPFPRITISWFNPLSDPVRVKRRLQPGSQPTSVIDTNPRVSFSWFGQLNEPVKVKPRLQPGSQPFTAIDTNPVVSFSWFSSLPEPVRKKRGLSAELQQFLALQYDIQVANLIFYTLDATETGDSFAGTIQIFDESPTGAIVGIHEIKVPDLAVLGTIEDQYQQIPVSLLDQYLDAFQHDAFQNELFDPLDDETFQVTDTSVVYFEVKANVTIHEIPVPNLAVQGTIETQYQLYEIGTFDSSVFDESIFDAGVGVFSAEITANVAIIEIAS